MACVVWLEEQRGGGALKRQRWDVRRCVQTRCWVVRRGDEVTMDRLCRGEGKDDWGDEGRGEGRGQTGLWRSLGA